MVKSKFSKEKILLTITELKEQTDKLFLEFCEIYGDDDSKTKEVYYSCETLNILIGRLNPAPIKQYKKIGASKILKNINHK
ncbi:hypothetical protein UFOVP105_42 [uncultured Caudovirales phage]|uniref:Uncharacterized protein n=1 Tax=uncultured Caudovirales phage TaxID=2100421 RepID=A0A6J5L5L6_9CAUD|nr:hypothetical protein UFOVP105_42 [uncultured Caudovirales phage]